MLKKLINFSLVIAICVAIPTNVFASNVPVRETEKNNFIIDKNIPVYITKINAKNDVDKTLAMEKSQEKIKASINANGNVNTFEGSIIIDQNFISTELDESEVESLINNKVFAKTFKDVEELVEAGVIVNNVNFYVDKNIFAENSNNESLLGKVTSGDPNDPTYWETFCSYLGSYQGYKFLYLESSIGVETSYVTPKNISTSFNWGAFSSKTFKSIITGVVDSKAKTFAVVINTIQNVFGSFQTPLNITFGSATDSKFMTKVRGDLYNRNVLIRDLDNRVNGYAYYHWGSTNQTRLYQLVELKYPISQRTPTTYNYKIEARVSTVKITSTPGFKGSYTYLEKVYNLYKNGLGYFTLNESLDVKSLITSILQ